MPFWRQRGRRSEASRWRLEAVVAASSRHVRRLTRLGPGVGERSHMVSKYTENCTSHRHDNHRFMAALGSFTGSFSHCVLCWETHRHTFWQKCGFVYFHTELSAEMKHHSGIYTLLYPRTQGSHWTGLTKVRVSHTQITQ